jgi:hypothetical protein
MPIKAENESGNSAFHPNKRRDSASNPASMGGAFGMRLWITMYMGKGPAATQQQYCALAARCETSPLQPHVFER